MRILLYKIWETILAVLPITVFVLILDYLWIPLGIQVLGQFLMGALLIIAGLSIFLFGIDIAISPVGNSMGKALARRKNLSLLIFIGVILGFFINIAEPDLLILASQIDEITGGLLNTWQILLVVSIGIGIMVALGLMRIVLQIPLKNMLMVMYGIIVILAIFTPRDFLGIAFDAGGATTGSMTVPFILALGMGVSGVHGGLKAEEDSFGLTAVASCGPMMAVFGMALVRRMQGLSVQQGLVENINEGFFKPFLMVGQSMALEVMIAISPIIIITVIAQWCILNLSKQKFRRILKGFIYTYFGFVLFLTGVNAGFMNTGKIIGEALTELSPLMVTIVGGVFGLLVILAEPSVHVLTAQIEEATGGAIHRRAILITLAVGVSLAIVLSIVRILHPDIELWQLLFPGYLLALCLSRIAPPLFVGIAFDSGGVASGPMTATFILAFIQGISLAAGGEGNLISAFGVIAMVALTPLITVQLFGIIHAYMEKRCCYEKMSCQRREKLS